MTEEVCPSTYSGLLIFTLLPLVAHDLSTLSQTEHDAFLKTEWLAAEHAGQTYPRIGVLQHHTHGDDGAEAEPDGRLCRLRASEPRGGPHQREQRQGGVIDGGLPQSEKERATFL